MIPAPVSLCRDYDIVAITDSAVIPPDPPAVLERLPGEGDEPWAARLRAHLDSYHKNVVEPWRARFDEAQFSGRWDGVLDPSDRPVTFRVRIVPVEAWLEFERIGRAHSLLEDQLYSLAFRMGVIAIDGLDLGGVSFKREPYVGPDGQRNRTIGDVLPAAVVNAICRADRKEHGRDVISSIAIGLLRQRGAPLGK